MRAKTIWYGPNDLSRLAAACIAGDEQAGRDRTVREFVDAFNGLSSTRKQKSVTEAAGLSRAKLSELAADGQLDEGRVRALLDAMKAESKPIKPKALGVIRKEHFYQRCEGVGCEMHRFNYKKVENITDDGIPSVVEVAFAVHAGGLDANAADQFAGKREPVLLVVHAACPRVQYADRGKSSVLLKRKDDEDEG